MVKVREELPQKPEGSVDVGAWLERHLGLIDPKILEKVGMAQALSLRANTQLTPALSTFDLSWASADILMALKPDIGTVLVALIAFPLLYGNLSIQKIQHELGDDIAALATQLLHLHTQSKMGEKVTDNVRHSDNLRRLLLTVVQDVRVVLIRLAMQIARIRKYKLFSPAEATELGEQTRNIYAPLANRLGVGNFKWELEDFAFRILEPENYSNIAKLLDEKRLDREQYILHMRATLSQALEKNNIHAQVLGRPKHIYSIWRKMVKKGLDFKDIYDVRALRVLVGSVSDCYATLGIVHALWQHIPKEFDDYIASPKENGYRSLHTAVYGPGGKALEVQIRTIDMDKEAECGIAAHWMYKEGKKGQDNIRLASVRQILDWQTKLSDTLQDTQELNAEVLDDQIYVFTPKGEVVELPLGSTPLDFAFHIHSDIGFGCRGAKVNGAMVSLNKPLKSGDHIEIISTEGGMPSRDWINPDLGFLRSSKAKAKVQAYFRKQSREVSLKVGRKMLEKELKRFGLNTAFSEIVELVSLRSIDELLLNIAAGELRLSAIIQKIQKPIIEKPVEYKESKSSGTDINIAGIGKGVVCTFAKCCRPVPGDLIVGYITRGRGISIHRQDCVHALAAFEEEEARIIQVSWGAEKGATFAVNVAIIAFDRKGLLNDITSVLSADKINVSGVRSNTDRTDNTAYFHITMDVDNLHTLGRIMNKIAALPNVLEVYREKAG